ncbi:MAG: DUF1707 domain-containing protein [Solirubrobacteraceae bacterium]
MPDPAGYRVSDEQRERAAQELRDHFAAGRLSDDELSERVQAVYQARADDELRALSADLPALPVTFQQQRAELAARRGELQRRLLQQTGGSLAPFLVCTGIWAASGASGFFWPIFVALAVLIPLIRNGWRLYGPAPELDRVDQELAVRERRAGRREAREHRRRR